MHGAREKKTRLLGQLRAILVRAASKESDLFLIVQK